MFASNKLVTVFAALAAAASAVYAAPAVFHGIGQEDLVVRPAITVPAAGALWITNTTQTISWDTSSIPAEAQNQTGLILLGHIEAGDTSEHLDIAHPLAAGFPIMAGTISVTVPDVDTRNDYVVVLFGDSGNTSGQFTITKA